MQTLTYPKGYGSDRHDCKGTRTCGEQVQTEYAPLKLVIYPLAAMNVFKLRMPIHNVPSGKWNRPIKESMLMRSMKILYLLIVLGVVKSVAALPTNHTDSLVNAAIDAGTFQNPSVNVRPRFRYWVPDASVDHATLAEDVKAAGNVGAGGVEVLGYYLYGGTPQGTGTFAPDNWAVYGWGTPAWRTLILCIYTIHSY